MNWYLSKLLVIYFSEHFPSSCKDMIFWLQRHEIIKTAINNSHKHRPPPWTKCENILGKHYKDIPSR